MIVDAGPLYAYVDADDQHHAACLELLERPPGPLVVPALVIAEVTHLLATVDASVVTLAERIGEVEVATIDRRDFSTVRPSHTDALTLLP